MKFISCMVLTRIRELLSELAIVKEEFLIKKVK